MDTKTRDLLVKLTKLANNNPNEHEANSAARRVAKMLEAANFQLDPTYNDVHRSTESAPWTKPPKQEEPKQQEPHWQYYNPDYTDFNDIFNEFFRQSGKSYTRDQQNRRAYEQEKKQSTYDPYHSPYTDPHWYSHVGDPPKSESPPKQEKQHHYQAKETDPVYEYEWDPILRQYKRKPKESQPRTCSKCGLNVNTFRFKEEPFICSPCKWGNYKEGFK